MFNHICMFMKLSGFETKWFWICCVNEDMNRNGYR